MDKKLEIMIKKVPGISESVAFTVLNTTIKEVGNKIPDLSGLAQTIMTLEYLKSTENALLLLIVINLQLTYSMQR